MDPRAEFLYHRKDGRDKTHIAHMDLMEMAIEPSYIARQIYKAMMKRDPAQAEIYKQMVIDAVTSPLTWDLTDATEPTKIFMVTSDPSGQTEVPN